MSDVLATTIKAASAILKSRRATELPPQSQLFTLRVTPKVDPIFTPRDCRYNDKVRKEMSMGFTDIYKARQELEYIRSLAPLGYLPLSLVPTDLEPYPPLMQYGWEISDSLKEQLFRYADSEGLNYVKRDGLTHSSEMLTFEVALDDLLEELDISWSSKEYIHSVLTKSARRALLFTLYSNHELLDLPNGNLPSKEDIDKISAFFQLTESPSWYPSSLFFEWGDSPLN